MDKPPYIHITYTRGVYSYKKYVQSIPLDVKNSEQGLEGGLDVSLYAIPLDVENSEPLFPRIINNSFDKTPIYCIAIFSPAILPNTKISVIALPPKRFVPCVPPTISPAAYSPSIGWSFISSTCILLLFIATPPIV